MNFSAKVRTLALIFIIGFSLVILKLIFVQIISAGSLSAQAEYQHFYTLSIPARRGEIVTSDGFPLASDKNAYLFYASIPKLPSDKNFVADKISHLLAPEIPFVATDSSVITSAQQEDFLKKTTENLKSEILAKVSVPNAVWANLSHFVDDAFKKKVVDLNIPGLGFVDEEARDYPESSSSAQLLGFVGFDKVGNPKGYFGLEGFYDLELSGKPGEIRVEKDALGRPIAIGQETRRDKQDGSDLVTTIDRGVQTFVEKYLKDGISTWKAAGGSAVVMDPNDGSIIAMASLPSYDPANFSYYPGKTYKNPVVSDLYEPGSIMKPLVMAAAINENKLVPQTQCTACDGPRQIGTYFIHTFDNKYHPNLTMTEVLINSDNTGMVFVGEKLGFTNLYSYMKRFGFGQKTGVDLQEEEEGSLRPVDQYVPIDQATMAFGQGIAVTTMQMMRAWSALANGGYLVTPHLVSTIKSQGKDIKLNYKKGEQVISTSTSTTVKEMLARVGKESETRFALDRIPELADFRIAAKSGTAQIAVGGKYQDIGTTASVISFFPADHPRFLIIVKLDSPEVRQWGSDTAGPILFSIMRDLAAYYRISP